MRRTILLMSLALWASACADADDQGDNGRRLGGGALADAPPAGGPPAPGPDAPQPPPPNRPTAGVARAGAVVINEVAAKGDPADWFELFNIDRVPVDVSGWTFDEDVTVDAPGLGVIADGTILAPGAFLRVEVSDEASGFKLGADEALILFNADGQVVDAVDWSDGDSPAGGSLARIPDGVGQFHTAQVATPAAQNTAR